MDKETLSHYGWIVIVVLVLAIMLALATPFGTYVGDAVAETARGFVGTAENNLNEDNIKEQDVFWDYKFENGVWSDGTHNVTLTYGNNTMYINLTMIFN